MSEKMYVEMGRLMEAHSNRAFSRERAKATAQAVKAAEADRRQFGCFEDCGDAYETWLVDAKSAHAESVRAKVSSEKRFKSLRLGFEETFGEDGKRAFERFKQETIESPNP